MTSTADTPSPATGAATAAPYYDPYDVAINNDPYPAFKALRDEAPVYYNEVHDFYALSRFDHIAQALRDHSTFISGRGGILELIKAGIEMPPGILIFEDPPTHTNHRRLLSRVFSPRRVAELEGKIRDFTVKTLDPLVGAGEFDVIADVAAQVPMKTISMLLGIPEADQERVRDKTDANLRTEEGKPMEVREDFVSGDMFADYIDWRADNPSDDLMTDLLNAEYEDENGEKRRLTRAEILTYVAVVAGAGNETTNRLIGWTAKVLADHPDQRRELVEDPELIPNAIEELLRFEGPAPHVGRYVASDVEIDGTTIPAGNAILLLLGAGNRDERKFTEPDRFDIHRDVTQMMTFGYGIHFCLGANLARMEGRVVLEEMLKRFPEWDVDLGRANLAPTSTVRGWETLPMIVGS
ncbi:MAG: cytochrome P450 [Acidimicrobiales bacterium]|nr:cytochrome P450 [Acidimicrobiales bacterium]